MLKSFLGVRTKVQSLQIDCTSKLLFSLILSVEKSALFIRGRLNSSFLQKFLCHKSIGNIMKKSPFLLASKSTFFCECCFNFSRVFMFLPREFAMKWSRSRFFVIQYFLMCSWNVVKIRPIQSVLTSICSGLCNRQ